MSKDNVKKCQSIWKRARHNALAHKEEKRLLEKKSFIETMIVSVLIVVPIALTSLMLIFSKLKQPITVFSVDIIFILPIIVVFCNCIALFITLLSPNLKYRERIFQSDRALSGYQLIAQKIRRLDGAPLDNDEAEFLIRHLEENFEVYKAFANEPSDQVFDTAKIHLEKLVDCPFNLSNGK